MEEGRKERGGERIRKKQVEEEEEEEEEGKKEEEEKEVVAVVWQRIKAWKGCKWRGQDEQKKTVEMRSRGITGKKRKRKKKGKRRTN